MHPPSGAVSPRLSQLLASQQKHYDRAIDYYTTAIDLCEKHNIPLAATYFTNIGRAYYENGSKDLAYKNFLLASEIYDNTFTLMGRSIAKEYCSLYYSEIGDFDTARAFLAAAKNAAEQLASPQEKSVLNDIQAKLMEDYPHEFGRTRA